MALLNEFLATYDQSDLSSEDFSFYQDLIFRLAGLSITEKKRDLLISRLRTHIQKNNFKTFIQYRDLLKGLPDEAPEIQNFINLMTTNKTDFFREPKHFQFVVENLIPQWLLDQRSPVTAWSCASSTGEEPYTLSMVLQQNTPEDFKYKILATDIDTNVLERAKNGVYPTSKLVEIPDEYHSSCIQTGIKSAQGYFKIKRPVYEKIQFKQHNLMENFSVGEEVFDLIMCRNVMIYFTPTTISKLIEKLHRALKKDGILFIGHSEAIPNSAHLFRNIQPAIYKKI